MTSSNSSRSSYSGSTGCHSNSSDVDGGELGHLSLIHARYINDPRTLCRDLRRSYGSDNIDIKMRNNVFLIRTRDAVPLSRLIAADTKSIYLRGHE